MSHERTENVRTIEDLKDAMRSLYSLDERDAGRTPSHSSLHRIRGAIFRGLDFARAENSQLDKPLNSILLGTDRVDPEHLGSSMLIDLVDVMDLWGEGTPEPSQLLVDAQNVAS